MKKIIILLFLVIASTAFAEDPFWVYLNYPYGGPVNDFAIDKYDNLFAACQNGLFRSTNHGESWAQIRKENIKQIEIDSNNNLYAIYFNEYSYINEKVIKSSDHGVSWDTLNNVWNWLNNEQRKGVCEYDILKISIDVNNRIYLGLQFAGDYDEPNKVTIHWDISKLLYSDDFGETWQNCTEYDYYKGDTAKIYLSSAYKKGILTAIREINSVKYFSISKDNGQSWQDHKFTDFYRNNFVDSYFFSDSILYVLSYNELFCSLDQGKSWIKIETPPSIYGYKHLSLHIEKENELWLVFIWGIYKSDDNGKTWLKINNLNYYRYIPGAITNLQKDIRGNFYLVGDLGILKSTDSCGSFNKSMNGFVNFLSSSNINISSDLEGNIFFGYDSIYKSCDNGVNWKAFYVDEGQKHNITCVSDGTILSAIYLPSMNEYKSKIYFSDDNGESWKYLSDIDCDVKRIIQDNKGFLYAIPYRGYVRRSTDKGKSWEFLENSTSVGAITLNNEQTIFIADYYSVFNSSDGGDSWNKLFDLRDSDSDSVNCIPVEMYCGIFHPRKSVGFFHGSCDFISSDNGKNWGIVQGYEKSRDSVDGYVRPGSRYYALELDSMYNLWGGYFRSTDFGYTWYPIDHGLEQRHKEVMAIGVGKNGYIYLATKYGGLYRSRDRYVSVPETQEPPGSRDELSASPNPFSDETSITYTLNAPGEVTISLYDLLGRQVAGIFNGWQDAGRHSVQLLITNYELPINPGVYFIRLETQKEVLVSKVIIIK